MFCAQLIEVSISISPLEIGDISSLSLFLFSPLAGVWSDVAAHTITTSSSHDGDCGVLAGTSEVCLTAHLSLVGTYFGRESGCFRFKCILCFLLSDEGPVEFSISTSVLGSATCTWYRLRIVEENRPTLLAIFFSSVSLAIVDITSLAYPH